MNTYAILFLLFGLYLSICIWIFLIITDSLKKVSSKGFFHVRQELVEAIDKHFILLSENQMVDEEEIRLLCRKLSNGRNVRYFLQKFIYNVDKIRDKNYIREYFKIVFPYLREMLQFERNMHYSEKSYRLMLLGEFRQDSDEINTFILDALDNESFDVRTNALRALSIIGNSDYFNRGLIKACSSDKYFNPRHISEMMGSFEGNHEELRNLMLDRFYDNSNLYRQYVIGYLANSKSSSSIDFVIKYLKNNLSDKEVVIACLRYFFVCDKNKGAKDIIMKLLSEKDYEIRAIAVKLTPMYFKNNPDVIQLIFGEKYLKSNDWYVRRNSAAALVRIGLTKEEIIKNLSMEDNYARDALVYAMFEDGLTTYDEFAKLGGDLVDELYA